MLQRAVRQAVRDARITKRASCHTFRHSFATRLLEDGVNPLVIRELMGHKNIETTMIYLHLMDRSLQGVRSPLDRPRRYHELGGGRRQKDGGNEDRWTRRSYDYGGGDDLREMDRRWRGGLSLLRWGFLRHVRRYCLPNPGATAGAVEMLESLPIPESDVGRRRGALRAASGMVAGRTACGPGSPFQRGRTN